VDERLLAGRSRKIRKDRGMRKPGSAASSSRILRRSSKFLHGSGVGKSGKWGFFHNAKLVARCRTEKKIWGGGTPYITGVASRQKGTVPRREKKLIVANELLGGSSRRSL